jgi:hypothetical protein
MAIRESLGHKAGVEGDCLVLDAKVTSLTLTLLTGGLEMDEIGVPKAGVSLSLWKSWASFGVAGAKMS